MSRLNKYCLISWMMNCCKILLIASLFQPQVVFIPVQLIQPSSKSHSSLLVQLSLKSSSSPMVQLSSKSSSSPLVQPSPKSFLLPMVPPSTKSSLLPLAPPSTKSPSSSSTKFPLSSSKVYFITIGSAQLQVSFFVDGPAQPPSFSAKAIQFLGLTSAVSLQLLILSSCLHPPWAFSAISSALV